MEAVLLSCSEPQVEAVAQRQSRTSWRTTANPEGSRAQEEQLMVQHHQLIRLS